MPLTLSLGRPLVEWLIVVGIVREDDMLEESEKFDINQEPANVQSVYYWLSEKPYGLWAEWDISNPARRLEAARWYVKQSKGYSEYLDLGGTGG